MSQIKQLLHLHGQGKPKKHIARILGISKNTVKGYLKKLDAINIDIDHLLSMDDPLLEKKFHSGNPAYKEGQYDSIFD